MTRKKVTRTKPSRITLSREALIVWETAAVLAAAALAGLVLLIFTPRTWLWYLLLWLIGLALVLAGSLYLPLYCLSCVLTVAEDWLEYQSGILFRTRRRMRKDAVMEVTVLKLPFLRARTVILNAMGGRLVIPFLTLRDTVLLLRETGEAADD